MKRVMVIGCSGSGKSTFSRILHQKTQLPLIHLDQAYWKPNWVEQSPDEWRSIVTKLASKESWIMDGNYSGTWDLRIPRADTIIFLDKSTSVCLYRVLKRIFQNYGKVRPDMVPGCPERLDAQFLHYVLVYNLTRRSKNLKRLKELKGEKQVFIFQKEKEITSFLNSLGSSN